MPRALVEGLAGGVVERAPEHLVAVVLADARQQRVPAAGDQAHERRLERGGRCSPARKFAATCPCR